MYAIRSYYVERSVNRGEKGIQIFAPSPYTIQKEKTKLDKDTQLPVLDKFSLKTLELEVSINQANIRITSYNVCYTKLLR